MRLNLSKKSIIILSLILVVIVGGGGGYLLWRVNQQDTVAPTDSDAAFYHACPSGYTWKDGTPGLFVCINKSMNQEFTAGCYKADPKCTESYAGWSRVRQLRILKYEAGKGGTLTGNLYQTIKDGTDGTAVKAVPNSGYVFVKWVNHVGGKDAGTANPRTDKKVTGNVVVDAIFKASTETEYTLKYTAGINGKITGLPTQKVKKGGDGTEVTAIPNEGYEFDKWSDNVTTPRRQDKDITKDITVSAIFTKEVAATYTLKYIAGANGKLEGLLTQTLQKPTTGYPNGKPVTAIGNTGYEFDVWSDGKSDNPRIDMKVMKSLTVTATFKKIGTKYTLTYIAGDNGTLKGTTKQYVAKGGSGSDVIAVPDEGYTFEGWSDGVKTEKRRDTNITKTLTVTAIFTDGGGGGEVPVTGIFDDTMGRIYFGIGLMLMGGTVSLMPKMRYHWNAYSEKIKSKKEEEYEKRVEKKRSEFERKFK